MTRFALSWSLLLAAGTASALRSGLGKQQAPLGDVGTKFAAGNPFNSDFRDFVNGVLDRWKAPGMTVAVIDGHDVFTEGFGLASLPDIPATPDTLYYVGSTTKAQLAATLAHLIDSKEYPQLARGWQTPISSIIRDDFVLKNEWATEHLTLEDAVSHRTGLTRHDHSWHRKDADNATVSIKDVVRNLRNLPDLSAEPRTEWHYCNLMFVTLSHVVETLTGRWVGDVIKETIWDPLDMQTTYLDLDEAKNAPVDFARSYLWNESSQEYEIMPFFPAREASGAGGVISNVVDYAKWVQCLIHETEPFSAAVHKDIRTPRSILSGQPNAVADVLLYGLAWMRTTMHGEVVYLHDGSTLTYGANVMWLPNIKYGLVAFANSNDKSNDVNSIVLRRLMEDKLHVPESKRVDVDKRSRDQREEASRQLKNAVDIVYPNRPKQPAPSTFKTSDLQGLYADAGYGPLRFTERPHPGRRGSTILEADMTDTILKNKLQLHHVSGDYWIAYGLLPGNIPSMTEYFAAQFLVGVDGGVSGLAIDFYDQGAGVGEGVVVFQRDT